ncbi:hypothetical protein [Xanthobacter tagetidis]|jgi:hypothetical protein|uniref:Uncharacterized protein n=2 Tax=Xanthobacter tagetidis TaxID=60216 RepID=A0A3L7AJ54_9HYPH|nr:hypothetical protein [Xanthobacter tagetidis]MBB6306854.1 hypothetical protein [Xanthobacter tagetidis]RLP80074.1 hypothetical protein D9R14_06890 [Xanthobacter tagetidis]
MRQKLRFASAIPTLAMAAFAGGAAADPAGLILTTDKVRSDGGGAFISVAVKNNSTQVIDQIVVTCTFKNGGKAVGTSSTTLFSTVPGVTGQDQVRLFGANATAADCAITSPKS